MQIPILNGIYADATPDLRTSYPRNMVPVPKQNGVSSGYLRPAEGIATFGAGPGIDRGAINWNGVLYRVMGTKLVRVDASGGVTVLGDVGSGGQVTLDYSFDVLGIAAGGYLWYWDGAALTSVTDVDIGTVVDALWIAGYWMTTDGTSLVVTELNDRYAVNPLKYGSAESDPDPVKAIDELRNEAYAFGRYTIEVFENVGGDGFPFARVEGAQVPRGIVGTYAYAPYLNTWAFVGSGRNEAPAVYLMVPGDTRKLSTREIDVILAGYSEAELAAVVMEARVSKAHQHLLVHLPDQTWVYDAAASEALGGTPVWFELGSSVVGHAAYRARNAVWVYDGWIVGDPTSTAIGRMVEDVSTHYGQAVGWEFGTVMLYNEGNDAIVHELELVALPGRVPLGAAPIVWTSYSLDGETWSQERHIFAGSQGQRAKRLQWRTQGRLGQYRMQKFRGTSDAHLPIARLEARLEPLLTRAGNG